MLLAGVLFVVTLATAAAFALKRWWFPPAINAYGAQFDSWFSSNLLILGVLFTAAQLGLAWLILRHRDRGQAARYTAGSRRLEWTLALAAIALYLTGAIGGTRLWSEVHFAALRQDGLQIEVAAKQFAWSFRYPGPDGRFGRTDLRLVNDAAGNPFGLVPSDEAGRDDIVNSVLRIPAGRHVVLKLHSQDVIHSFFVRELRLKQDVVPGMEIPLRFQARSTGEYEIACAELCGLGHHQMRSRLLVLTPEAFDAWLAGRASP